MSPSKRALLIASPFGRLQGTLNDVETIAVVLEKKGFVLERCCGEAATREGILSAWRSLIAQTQANDVLVVFYAGHGGLVEQTGNHPEQRLYQFLVPVDYTEAGDFRGILDIELSYYMWMSTGKTQNVTIILDCCHSGRMVRNPVYGGRAMIRAMAKTQRHDIAAFMGALEADGPLGTWTRPEVNTSAVRIVAASTFQSAWELDGHGVMTHALAKAIRECSDRKLSWRTSMLYIRGLVTAKFPQQHPQIEGPDQRLHFSLEETTSGLHIKLEAGVPVVQGGRAAGVERGNIYAVMPLGSERNEAAAQLGTAKVTDVSAFNATVTLFGRMGSNDCVVLPEEGALLFQTERALTRRPVRVPREFGSLRAAIERSKYITNSDHGVFLSSIVEENGRLILLTSEGIEIASQLLSIDGVYTDGLGDIVRSAEQHARATHLLALQPSGEEIFEHDLKIAFFNIQDGVAQHLPASGTGIIVNGDRICISMRNCGAAEIFVSLFNINIAGRITLLSKRNDWVEGIRIAPGHTEVLGKKRDSTTLIGMPVCWPKNVAAKGSVPEHFLFVITERPIDLGHLETSTHARTAHQRQKVRSSLQDLTYQIAAGGTRDVEPLGEDWTGIRFQATAVSFSLITSARPISAAELPEPDDSEEWQQYRLSPYGKDSFERGLIGAVVRASKGVPPCIWVVNDHTEEITVVTSKTRPSRLFSGGELGASPTGGSLSFSTTSYNYPATKKVLKPGDKATFPLWNRKDAVAVITIFTGTRKTLFVENDQVPIGSTVSFTNKPDLQVVSTAENND